MDAKQTLGEPRLLISRSALLHNAGMIRKAIPPGTRICAILKANAYGHCARIVADALCNYAADASDTPAVDGIAVASIEEAAELPDVNVPVTIFRPLENAFLGRQRAKLDEAVRHGWVLTLCSPAGAEDLARIAVAAGKRAAVQVMIDTGMTRAGVEPGQFAELLQRIGARPSLRLVGVCTHFSDADEQHSNHTLNQIARFRQCTDPFADLFRGKVMRHAANSGAVFFLSAAHLDMVRPGIALYGIDPTGTPSVSRALRPVMKWTAPLIGIRQIRRGICVGYGQTWQAARDTRIGLVPVGYADGYLRAYSNRAVMLVHGKPAPVVGRVSMDLTTIDLGSIPQAQVGDEVTLLDNDPLSPVSAYALAKWADTIPYEIFCRIGPRIQRVAVAPEGWEHLGPPLAASRTKDVS
ncbi:MAG TPA: alanine racemase [Tepidisphaeraceae bacterium]|jgi:alanine racemase